MLLTHLSITRALGDNHPFICIFTKKLKNREIKELAKDHTPIYSLGQDSNSGSLAPEPMLLIIIQLVPLK